MAMVKREYKFVVLGSGAGGATLARELRKRGSGIHLDTLKNPRK